MRKRYCPHSLVPGSGIILFVLLAFNSCRNHQEIEETSENSVVDLVEPLVDAANSRWFFFNSATRPFGMVNLSPDMIINGAWNSGYRYNEDTIRAFSHIHAWQLSGIPVFPTTGECRGHLGADVYGSAYSHENETVRPCFNHYNSDSFWGAQWTLNTLWHLVYPEISEEFVNSMLLMHEDGGLIPRGPSGGNYTFVMTGASSTPFIVSAYMKGIRGFDAEKAYEGMKKNHLPGGLMSKAGYEHDTHTGGGLKYYMDRGYIPYPLPEEGNGFHEDGSGQTLEYAYQDWTLAQMAGALGKNEDHDYFMNRSLNYKNIWYGEKGWMWIKDIDGHWREPFDVLAYQDGWVESNAAQSTWFVPHDLKGLAGLMGGPDSLVNKLNRAFEWSQPRGFVASKSHATEVLEENRRTYINYGNQPSMQTAFIFNYAGVPWLTQKWSRLVTDSVYSGISPQKGYSGDEDQGLMGSLAVLLKMGLFSMKGGTSVVPVYEIGSPIFDRITIHLNKEYYPGDSLVIQTTNNSAENCFIQSISFNGEPTGRIWIDHQSVAGGGILQLEMGPEPNKAIKSLL